MFMQTEVNAVAPSMPSGNSLLGRTRNYKLMSIALSDDLIVGRQKGKKGREAM